MSEKVKNIEIEVLSDNWYTLRKATFFYQKKDGQWEKQSREAYDRGNGAAILLYDPDRKTVVLTRQFRMPTYLNGNPTGMMVEVPAGLLDEHSPEDCIRREVMEETGYHITDVRKVFQCYMSPGSVTEILHFFVATYSATQKTGIGGGEAAEQEEIEVLEWPAERALAAIATGDIQDAKSILLLQYGRLNGLI